MKIITPTPTPWHVEHETDVEGLLRTWVLSQNGQDVLTFAFSQEHASGEPDQYAQAIANASLLVATTNSYAKHAKDPLAAAEGDLLGQALALLQELAEKDTLRPPHHEEFPDGEAEKWTTYGKDAQRINQLLSQTTFNQ